MISQENEKISELTESLESDGFRVVMEPSPDDIPFPLSPYRPDLIAYKNGGGIVIEVKKTMKRMPVSYFQEISERVTENEGWKFALVTLDNPLSSNFVEGNLIPITLDSIKARQQKLKSVVDMELYSAAIQEAWSLIEACLRLIAFNARIPLELSQSTRLLNHLYSSGELSMDQHRKLKKHIQIRNRVAHGMPIEITHEKVIEFNVALIELVEQIESENQQ